MSQLGPARLGQAGPNWTWLASPRLGSARLGLSGLNWAGPLQYGPPLMNGDHARPIFVQHQPVARLPTLRPRDWQIFAQSSGSLPSRPDATSRRRRPAEGSAQEGADRLAGRRACAVLKFGRRYGKWARSSAATLFGRRVADFPELAASWQRPSGRHSANTGIGTDISSSSSASADALGLARRALRPSERN